MVNKILVGLLTFLILVASVAIILPGQARIDVKETYSTFKVMEEGSWVLSGQEYTLLFDGTKKMRANNRVVNYTIDENETTAYRYAFFKEGCSVIDTYIFNSSTDDVELFPVSHQIETFNCNGFTLMYEVTKLEYFGETDYEIGSSHEFGHNMKVEWEDGNYYERLYKYKNRDEGKLTIKYKIEEDYLKKNVRLYDPIISNDNVFTNLLYNKADIAGGEAIFEFNNPVDNLDMEDLYGSYFLAEGVNYNSLEFFVEVEVPYAFPIYEDKNVSYSCEIFSNETGINTSSTCYKIESELVNHEIEFSREWKKVDSLDKGKHNIKIVATWDAHLGLQSSDWFPNLHLDKEKYELPKDKFGVLESKHLKQSKWEWWNVSWEHYKEYTNLTGNITYMVIDAAPTDNADFNDTRFISCYNDTLVFNHTLEDKFGTSGQFRTNNLGENCTLRYYNNSVVSTTSNASDVYFEPISAYYFDANANDFVGSNDGIVNGATLTDGYINGSYDFNGATDDINLTQGINPLTAITFNVWINRDTTDNEFIAGKWLWDTPDANGRAWGMQFFSNALRFYISSDGTDPGSSWAQSAVDVPSGSQHMVTGTFDGTNIKVYIDRVLNGTTAKSSGISNEPWSVYLGIQNGESTEFSHFNGKMDEVLILDYALTQNQITALYNQKAPIFIEGPEQSQLQPPVVIINSPLNNSNFDTSSITINGTAHDDINLINVSYILNDVYQETNNSGINNTFYIFTDTLGEDNYNFSIEACDNSSSCTNEFGNFSVDFPPEITANATSPDEVFRDTDYKVNLTIQDNSDTINGHVQFYVNGIGIGDPIQTIVSNNVNTLVGTLLSGNFSGGDSLIAEVWASDSFNTIAKENLTTEIVGFYENVSLLNAQIDIDDVILSSTTNVVLFNGTVNLTEPHHFTAKGAGGLIGTTGGTVSVNIQMDVAGVTIIDEVVGSVSLASDRKQFTVSMNDTLVQNGTSIITVYGRTSVNKAVQIYSLEFFGDTDVTNSDEEVSHYHNSSQFSFSNVGFENIENFTFDKNGHNSSIVLDFKTTQQASGAGSVSCYLKNQISGEVSPTTTNYISGAAETRSGGINWIPNPTSGDDVLEMWCASLGGATVDLNTTIYIFDSRTVGGNFIGNFQNQTQINGLSGSDQLITYYNYTVLDNSKVDILATVVFESTSGSQTGTSAPMIWVNSSNDSINCLEEYNRSFTASSRPGVVKFYVACSNVSEGISYPFNLYASIAGGETMNILNASLSGFETEELNITNLIVSPVVSFYNPINGSTINENETIIVNITDFSEVGWKSNVNLTFPNGTFIEELLLELTTENTTNLSFQSENYIDGDYRVLWVATNDGGSGSDDVFFTIDNTGPVLIINQPINQTYSTTRTIPFEVSGNEAMDVCLYSLDDWVTNQTMTEFNSTWFNYTQTSVADGGYTARFSCNDTIGNYNNSAFRVFEVDTVQISLISPPDETITDTIPNDFVCQAFSLEEKIENISL